jgi:hypothetical protein
MRKSLALAMTAATTAGLAAFVPAAANAAGGCAANCSASTNVTFSVTGNGLTLSVPTNPGVTLPAATLALGAASVSGPLNTTTVSDLRGVIGATWSVGVTGSGFAGSGTAAGFTIPAGNASMWLTATDIASGASLGEVLNVANTATQATPASVGGAASLVAGTTGLNTGSMTYTPQISVSIPTNAPAGSYSGSVTQTVS